MAEVIYQFENKERKLESDSDSPIDIRDVIATLHRNQKLIAICVAITLVIGAFYVVVTPLKYEATVSILIDPRQKMVVPDMLKEVMSFKENLILDSQIEIMQSDRLIEKAVERIGLFKSNPEEEENRIKYKGAVSGDVSDKKVTEENMRIQNTLDEFRGGLNVSREGKTYILKVSYTSQHPEMSTARANLVADTYLENEMAIQFETSRRTHTWLDEWAEKTRNELSAVEKEIDNYKTQRNIVEAHWSDSVSSQQLLELNKNLSDVRIEAAHAKARYETLMKVIEVGDTDTITSDLVKNTVINDLRNKYVSLSQSAANIKRSGGGDYKPYKSLIRQMSDVRKFMIEEYKRVAKGYKNKHEIGLSKQQVLQKELDMLTSSSLVNQENHIELRQLQLRAESIKNLYTKLLNNLNEKTELQSAPFAPGRVINYAKIPRKASWPKIPVIMFFAAAIGLLMGISLAFAKEYLNKFIWRVEELEQATHRTCFGLLPKLDLNEKEKGRAITLADCRDELQQGRPSFNSTAFDELTQIIEQQTSVTTEVMRKVQLAIKSFAPEKSGSVISFVSANPGDGKSFTSCFLAKHLANSGAKVALIDCDFRRPTLTNMLFPTAEIGFYEMASQMDRGERVKSDQDITSIFHKTSTKQLFFVPAKGASTSVTNLDMISSNRMQNLITLLKQEFDYVLIDLPPVVNTVDARAISHVVDHFIFLARWGKVHYHTVHGALMRAPEVYEKTVGTLLTQADLSLANRYGYGYGSYDNYESHG
ncbi:MAG: AAA family ATPase [Rickettsiales bacterium]|nr:AAA family ATPase [Rickettsiales bacterium]